MESIVNEQPVLAINPTDIKVLVVRDSSTSTARELGMRDRFPSMNELVEDGLTKLESAGFSLLDIRYSAIPQPNGGYEHFAMLIGRRRSK
jgi:hypothetical protein